jgi:uncharacterized protein YggE
MKLFISIFILLSSVSIYASDSVKTTELPQSIFFTGEAELVVPTKDISVSIRITTKSELLKPALEKNITIRKEIVTELVKGGVPVDNFSGNGESTIPYMNRFSSKTTQYTIVKDLSIKLNSENELLIVAGIVDKYSEIAFTNTTYSESNKDSIETEVLLKALGNGKEKIDLIEKSTGLKYKIVATHIDFKPPVYSTNEHMKAIYAGRTKSLSLSLSSRGELDGIEVGVGTGAQKTFYKKVYIECQVINESSKEILIN